MTSIVDDARKSCRFQHRRFWYNQVKWFELVANILEDILDEKAGNDAHGCG